MRQIPILRILVQIFQQDKFFGAFCVAKQKSCTFAASKFNSISTNHLKEGSVLK